MWPPAAGGTVVSPSGARPTSPRAALTAATGPTSAVQKAQRLALIGISDRHSGQSRVLASSFFSKRL